MICTLNLPTKLNFQNIFLFPSKPFNSFFFCSNHCFKLYASFPSQGLFYFSFHQAFFFTLPISLYLMQFCGILQRSPFLPYPKQLLYILFPYMYFLIHSAGKLNNLIILFHICIPTVYFLFLLSFYLHSFSFISFYFFYVYFVLVSILDTTVFP